MLRHGATLVLLQPSLPGRNPNSCSQHHVLVSAGSGGASPVRGRGAQQLLPVLCLWLVPLGAALIPCVRTASGCSCGQDLPFFFFCWLPKITTCVRLLGAWPSRIPRCRGEKREKKKKKTNLRPEELGEQLCLGCARWTPQRPRKQSPDPEPCDLKQISSISPHFPPSTSSGQSLPALPRIRPIFSSPGHLGPTSP